MECYLRILIFAEIILVSQITTLRCSKKTKSNTRIILYLTLLTIVLFWLSNKIKINSNLPIINGAWYISRAI